MLSRGGVAGFVWGFVAVALSAGCATQRSAGSPVVMDRGSSWDTASIAGVWEGEVWEMPTHYLQGVRRITLNISRDGRWTATSAGTTCASGTLSVRGSLVVLGGERTGPDFCMPYSVASSDGRMNAVFETSFKARQASAMIDLQRVREPMPEAAQGPTQP
ncbi:MAG: hypothetical protein DME01_23940 [Candidatus Rokuibacteriota bacterium]|nr:MAG: hypothetical protein DME01_23940 [Candidatus Rokubacteria bacterium]